MREITVRVRGPFLQKNSKLGGIQGEGNVTRMRLLLDESWAGVDKRIVWRDARGLNAVATVLGVQHKTEEGSDLDYTVWIPPEPLAHAGWCSFALEGYTVQADGTVAVMLTAADRLEVKAGEYGQPAEPTPSQALQLQHELELIVGEVPYARAHAEDALAAKQAADACVDDAAAYALQAEGSAMLSKSWASGGTGMRAEEETANAKYWASLAHAAAGGGVLTFCGRTGAVSPESGDYTAEQVGASPVGHIHTAADLTGGTLGGAVVAHSEAQQDLTLMQVRNISAGTADLTAGESELAEGQIYLVYEEV